MEAGAGGEDWIPRGPGRGGGPSLSTLLSQLPSSATVRYRGPGVPPWGEPEAPLEQSEHGDWLQEGSPPGTPPESQALRELPWPMEAKRFLWKLQAGSPARPESGIRRSKGPLRLGRAWARLAGAPKILVPWRTTLTRIGGQYGAGTESYFALLRFLLGLNILGALFQGALILLPLLLLGPIPGPPLQGVHQPCGPYDPLPQGLVDYPTLLTNLLSGEGHLEWSPLFYGFYPAQLSGGTFRLPVAYLLSTFVSGLLCLLLILHRSVSGLKQTLLSESGALTSYSHRVFSAWDFGLRGAGPVELRRRALRYELQVELEEASERKRAEARSRAQWAGLWAARILLNLLVLAMLGAAFYGIYWAVDPNKVLQNVPVVLETPVLRLLVAYLPSIFISAANLLLPPVFGLITGLEGYPRSRQLQLLLLRTVFLRLASPVVLLASLWNEITCGGKPEAEACATCGYNSAQRPVTAGSRQRGGLGAARGPRGVEQGRTSGASGGQGPGMLGPRGGGGRTRRRGAMPWVSLDGPSTPSPVLGNPSGTGDVQAPAVRPADRPGHPAAGPVPAQTPGHCVVRPPGPAAGRHGVPGPGRGAGARVRADAGLDRGLLQPPPSGAQRHQIPDHLLPEEVLALLLLFSGLPHVPGVGRELLLPAGAAPGLGHLGRARALRHLRDPTVQAVWPLPGPSDHLGGRASRHPGPAPGGPRSPFLPGDPKLRCPSDARVKRPDGLHADSGQFLRPPGLQAEGAHKDGKRK